MGGRDTPGQVEGRPPAGPYPPRAPAATRVRPLGAASVTIYATLICLGLAIPGSIVGALRDAPPSTLTAAALSLATRLEAGLEATGFPALYRAAKERFRQVSCGAPDSANPC